MVKEKKLTAEQQIIKHMEDNGQKLLWLSNKIGISVGHLHCVLKGSGEIKRDLTKKNLNLINEALRTEITF